MNLSSDISNFQYNPNFSNKLLLSSKDEFSLWQEFKMGCKESYSIIYHRYFNELYNYGLKISGDENLTKDCLQEMFVNIWFSREKLGDVKSIKFYLIKSFRRNLIHFIKKSKKEKSFKIIFTQNQPNILFSSEELIVAEETLRIKKEHLAKILNSLPKRRKEALYLRYYRELSYEETAQIMNLTEKAVINHVYKAFKSIKKSIKLNGGLVQMFG